MNTEQLVALVNELVEDDENFKIQPALATVSQALANLAANPQDPAHQTAVASAMEELANASDLEYVPATLQRMEEIGAKPYFTSAMVARLRQSMEDNPMTPAIVQTEAAQLVQERAEFLNHLLNLQAALSTLGFQEDELKVGEAEIGFQLPRSLFRNELEGFAKELHELRLIIRAFSEAAGNTGERIQLRQISTSDPLIYVLLGYLTISKIGGAVKWCLDQWKTLEEIRGLRASTANLKGVPAAQKMAEQFDEIIEQTVTTRIREEAERLSSEANADASRENELANHLAKALEGLLARIERGMKVDIRVLPPSTEGETVDKSVADEFDRLEELRDELVFPVLGNDPPILKLTKQPEPPRGSGGKRKPDPS
ncbi:hypothetical protein [Sphingomonas sp. URHD0057]|uniref:hypothetical protein n=1 Tax=Sphingomonas sp. URHD0057 TaxID=1380389 RepID=UPI00048FB694|nr:hypothetical protein [Sphingomonas sp. URHD0057]